MKKLILLFSMAIGFLISLYFTKELVHNTNRDSCGRINCHGGSCPFALKTSEASEEDPIAKLRYDWMRFRDPASNQIPFRMRFRENKFVNSRFRVFKKSSSTISYDWTSQGPFKIGGRILAIGVDVDNENTILVGCASGGAWKTDNGGQNWVKTTSPNQIQSVTCFAQNKSSGRHNIWYYGTGEFQGGAAAAWPMSVLYTGDGIFKSTDNGNSWNLLSSTSKGFFNHDADFSYVFKIITFGEDGILAATTRGIFRSTDGGISWQKVINSTSHTNYSNNITSDIAITSEGIYYATIGTTYNYPNVVVNTGIYRSENGIDWQNITPPQLSSGTMKTEITPLPTNENIIYFFSTVSFSHASLMTYEHGVGWTDISSKLPPWVAPIPTYGGQMQVFKIKPNDPNTMFISGIDLSRTTNNGLSWESAANITNSYADQMDIIFSQNNPNRMYLSNDGGIWKVENCSGPILNVNNVIGLPFESLNNEILSTQFYSISIDHGTPNSNIILGGMQDRGIYARKTSDLDGWKRIVQGDGGYTAISDGGDYYYLSMASTHFLARVKRDLTEITQITPSNTDMTFFISPLILDPFDNKIMYVACRDNSGSCIYRNTDLSQIPYTYSGPSTTTINWSNLISFDPGETCLALGMSPSSPRKLYFSTISNSHGLRFFKLDNPHLNQSQKVELNLPQLTMNERFYGFISCISVDPLDPNKVILAFSNYGMQSLFYSEDGCNTWTPVSGNLEENPDGSGNGPSLRWISVLYVQNRPIYFAATSVGLFSTTRLNGMNTNWVQEGANTIGNMPIDMIDVRQSDGFVAVGTMGNGVYSTFITSLPSISQYTVNVNTNIVDGGSVSGGGTYDDGSTITVTATPSAGYRFLNWTEGDIIVSTNPNYSFTLRNDRNLMANFEVIPILEISPENIQVTSMTGNSFFNVSNPTTTAMNWIASSNVNWINIISGNSGTDNGTVEFTYQQNIGDERTGTITITALDAIGSPKIFEVRQAVATDIKNEKIPTIFGLEQNYPNPFNPETVIRWQLPIGCNVILKLYDIQGKEVTTLVNEYKPAGKYFSKFSTLNSQLPSGIYFYKIVAGKFTDTKKLVLLK